MGGMQSIEIQVSRHPAGASNAGYNNHFVWINLQFIHHSNNAAHNYSHPTARTPDSGKLIQP